jgi:molecular chaperone HtpG
VGGRLTFPEATKKSEVITNRSFQIIDRAASAPVSAVVPDVIANAESGEKNTEFAFLPLPPIERLDIATDHKLLTIEESEPALKGYRCFLAISDRVREKLGDFFLQPHKTSIVWGGQKALFIFEHHSGDFGLYYDIQTQTPISDQSGGGSFQTCTIVMKNKTFIPIPINIQPNFVPSQNERKRLEVRCDVLHIDRDESKLKK